MVARHCASIEGREKAGPQTWSSKTILISYLVFVILAVGGGNAHSGVCGIGREDHVGNAVVY